MSDIGLGISDFRGMRKVEVRKGLRSRGKNQTNPESTIPNPHSKDP